MVCLYGPTVMLLPSDQQMVLWQGKSRAKNYMQANHWDTRREISKQSVRDVYSDLFGVAAAMDVVSAMDRADKEAEAARRLNED